MNALAFFIGLCVGILLGAFIIGLFWSHERRELRDQEEQRRKLPPASRSRFEVISPVSNTKRIYEFNHATPAQMVTLADALASGAAINTTLFERIWGTRIFANAIRDELIEKNYLHWRNPLAPKEGMVTTEKGRAFFSGLSSNTSLNRYQIQSDVYTNTRRTHRVIAQIEE